MIVRMDAHGLTQLTELMRQAPEITREEMERAQTHATKLLQSDLQRDPAQGGLPKGVGGNAGLSASVHTRLEWWPDSILIGLVETSSPYARYVEEGTRPHWPGREGLQSLEDWAKAVLPGVSNEKEAKQAAFAVAWKIARHGTKPKPVWRTVWANQEKKVREIFEGVVARVVRRIAAQQSGGAL